MAKEFRLPDIGEGLTEAEIVRWHIPVGGEVAIDQTVVEVETDKAVVEIPSPFGGVVLAHGGAEGEIVAVGNILLVVGEPGEQWPSPAGGEAAPIVGTISSEAVDLTVPTTQPSSTSGGRPLALPVVRKLARDLGVDLEAVAGSGPGRRITRDDVMAAAGTPEVAAQEPVPTPAKSVPDAGRKPMSKLRRTIAANMSKSWAEIPHVTTFDHVDAGRLLEVRTALSRRHGSVSIDAMIAAAVVPALAEFPSFNAALDGDDLVIHDSVDLGVAVDTPDGLLVAVLRDAGSKSVLEMSAEIRRLAEGAKERKLAPTELTGQTFTISNIGAVGGGLGTPIVPYGTVGILSVGRAVDTPVARNGAIEIAPMMPLSLSYDHRVIDGGEGRRFMALVLENLAEPALFLT